MWTDPLIKMKITWLTTGSTNHFMVANFCCLCFSVTEKIAGLILQCKCNNKGVYGRILMSTTLSSL